jgi:glutathione peroxidase
MAQFVSRPRGQKSLKLLLPFAVWATSALGAPGQKDSPSTPAPVSSQAAAPSSSSSEKSIIWSHLALKSIGGKEFKADQLTDKVVLVVNTASKCGYTPQLKDLQALYQKYQEKGLVVLGFPSDDFNQDPGSNQEIAKFCELNYGVKFPLMAKGAVSGDKAQDLFRQLTQASPEKGDVQWNFEKFLVSRKGKVVARFRSGDGAEKIESALNQQL